MNRPLGTQLIFWGISHAFCLAVHSQSPVPYALTNTETNVVGEAPVFWRDMLFFDAEHPDSGTELYKSNGTAEGTVLVRDIYPGAGDSTPEQITPVLGLGVFFSASDAKNGKELWITDGTAAGTRLVMNIASGLAGSNCHDLISFGGMLYFFADDGIHGDELWRSDGTARGTTIVKDMVPGETGSSPLRMIATKTKLYFKAEHPTMRRELWVSDGTGAGTRVLKDINLDDVVTHPIFGPYGYCVIGSILFFYAESDIYGDELWKTDGTSAGTVLVKDINPGPAGSRPTSFYNLGGILLFHANDGIHGQELWRSDGTPGGTLLVKDVSPDAIGARPDFAMVAGGLFFMSVSDGGSNFELWRSDGTTAGTVKVKEIIPGSSGIAGHFLAGSKIANFSTVGIALYFKVKNGTDYELWRSDGTATGTRRVFEILEGRSISNINHITAANHLYFQANRKLYRVYFPFVRQSAELVTDENLETEWNARLLGNPQAGGVIEIELSGNPGDSFSLDVSTTEGEKIARSEIKLATRIQHVSLPIRSNPASILFIKVHRGLSHKTLKVLQ